MVRRSSAPATAAVARIKGSTSTISGQDATEKLTPNRCHAAYKRLTSGFVVMVLIEETFEAGSARLIDTPEPFVLAAGILLSNFVWNTFAMRKPFVGTPVGFRDYFAGRPGTHLAGVVGGVIWGVDMSFNLIASGRAGFAISYALGQGATMIAAFWGVFIWKWIFPIARTSKGNTSATRVRNSLHSCNGKATPGAAEVNLINRCERLAG